MVNVKLLYYTEDGEKLVALAAKRSISRRPVSEMNISEEEVEKWIFETFRRQHWSPWEFSWYVFEVENCSRVCSHQLVRHRLASYIQLSQRHSIHILRNMFESLERYVPIYCKKNDYMCYALLLDRFAEKLERENNPVVEDEMMRTIEETFEIPESVKKNKKIHREFIRYLINSVKFYLVMINEGIPLEDARYILPQSTRTRIIVAMNARELVTSFLPLRMCSRAQREIKEVAWKLWIALKNVHPKLFKYVGPRCILLENTLREKPAPLEDYLKGNEKIEVIPRCPELVPRERVIPCIRYAHDTAFKSNIYTDLPIDTSQA